MRRQNLKGRKLSQLGCPQRKASNTSGSFRKVVSHFMLQGPVDRMTGSQFHGLEQAPGSNCNRPAIVVYDDKKRDVTPRPLYIQNPGDMSRCAGHHFDSTGTTPIDLCTLGSAQHTTDSFSSSILFSRSFRRSSSSSSHHSITSMITEAADAEILQGIEHEKQVQEHPFLPDPEKLVSVVLCESETFTLIDIPAVSVSEQAPEASAVCEQNQQYIDLCQKREGCNCYDDGTAQTFCHAQKNKDVQSEHVTTTEKGVECTAWDLHDSFQSSIEKEPKHVASHTALTSFVLPCYSTPGQDSRSGIMEEFSLENLWSSLRMVERMLATNELQLRLAIYRQLTYQPDDDSEVKQYGGYEVTPKDSRSSTQNTTNTSPALDQLWVYGCALTKGRNVSCLAVNQANKWPERVYRCEAGVTAIAFSITDPNLLAVGSHDGVISIYNVRNVADIPLLSTRELPGRHMSTIWDLCWVDTERGADLDRVDLNEDLVSVSGDGRVTKWMILKNLGFNGEFLMCFSTII
uniref:Dynein axonemal intermediate chain 4 n=1 Tax=Eptatretus burgeri TaxID=7764 RepID=A0A8C4R3Z9_EPTBU